MGEKKIVIDKTVDVSQTAAFLRLLANELEGKSSPDPDEYGRQLHDFNKLKLCLIKQEGGELSLRLKVKGASAGPSAPAAAPSSSAEFTDIVASEYRPFKQQLKNTFAELTTCVSGGQLPSPQLLARFMAQSQQLVSFKGLGDPYYSDYTQACQALAKAVESGDAATLQERLAAIQALKKSCHRRFR